MGKKIYVGNLSYNMDDQTLGQVFSAFGTVESARIVTDRESGRSKGFGFVEMSSDSEASAAIDKLNGTDQLGRSMNVSEAKPMAPRENRGGGGGELEELATFQGIGHGGGDSDPIERPEISEYFPILPPRPPAGGLDLAGATL